jgi:hypothetical protein
MTDLEVRPATVSQHRSAVVLLRFGNEQRRCLRRPRYRDEHSPFAGHSRSSGRRKRVPSKFFARLSHSSPDQTSLHRPARRRGTEACIDQHGAEGPGALQVLIKAPMGLPDLEGCSSFAAAEPIRAQTLGVCLVAAKRCLYRPARRRGTGRPPGLDQSSNGPP